MLQRGLRRREEKRSSERPGNAASGPCTTVFRRPKRLSGPSSPGVAGGDSGDPRMKPTHNDGTRQETPRPARRSWKRHGNPPGDLSNAARWGAKTRRASSCQAPAMRNGRCRMHGGLSTAPKTAEGLERSRKARWVHGGRSREVRERLGDNRRRWRALVSLLCD